MLESEHSIDILFYIEDPGAANYIIHLPPVCDIAGLKTVLIYKGKAENYIKNIKTYCRSFHEYSSAEKVIEEFRPRLIVTGTAEDNETPGLSLIKIGKKYNISTVGIIDTHINAAYRFCGKTKTPLHFAPDFLIVPDQWTYDAFAALGYSPDKIKICGHPQYDYVKKIAEQFSVQGKEAFRSAYFPDVPAEQQIVLFAAELSDGFDAKQFQKSSQYTLYGNEKSTKRTDVVLDEFLHALNGLTERRPSLVLRLHPKNTVSEFSDYLKMFDKISVDEPVLEILYAVDRVVGMTSMLLLEAALLGKPTLSIIPRIEEKMWLPTISAGLTPCATSRESLQKILPYFLNKNTRNKRTELQDFFVFGATEKCLVALKTIIENGSCRSELLKPE